MCAKKSNWKRKLTTEQVKVCNKIKNKIIEKQKEKTGITTSEILRLMQGTPNFIGCFAENQLAFTLTSFPAFLIVNVDHSSLPGSHWIGLMVDKTTVEVFDPLGFNIFNWARIPCTLLSFVHHFSSHRKLFIYQRSQPDQSTLCGFYAMFFVLYRQKFSPSSLNSLFSRNLSKNDSRLINLL